MISKSKNQKKFISSYGIESNYEIGKKSERRVRIYLLMRLYKILFTNWRYGNQKGTGAGEVDIIAKKGNTIIFIEIKARKNEEDIFYSITTIQQKRIVKSAMLFLAKHSEYENCDIRFDAIFVSDSASKSDKIIHIQNAFDASDFADISSF